jgi:hypothetical protein
MKLAHEAHAWACRVVLTRSRAWAPTAAAMKAKMLLAGGFASRGGPAGAPAQGVAPAPAQPEQEATPPQEGPATPGARARSPTPKDFSPKDSSPSQVTALPAPRHPPSVPVREPRRPPPPPYLFPYRSPYCMPVAPPKAAHRRVRLVRGEGRGVST